MGCSTGSQHLVFVTDAQAGVVPKCSKSFQQGLAKRFNLATLSCSVGSPVKYTCLAWYSREDAPSRTLIMIDLCRTHDPNFWSRFEQTVENLTICARKWLGRNKLPRLNHTRTDCGSSCLRNSAGRHQTRPKVHALRSSEEQSFRNLAGQEGTTNVSAFELAAWPPCSFYKAHLLVRPPSTLPLFHAQQHTTQANCNCATLHRGYHYTSHSSEHLQTLIFNPKPFRLSVYNHHEAHHPDHHLPGRHSHGLARCHSPRGPG